MSKTISRGIIRDGLANEVIRLIIDPIMGTGTVCEIGDGWFYFGGITTEGMRPEDVAIEIPEDDIIDEIYNALEDFRTDDVFSDEYEYYRTFLEENLTITTDNE